MENEHQGQLSFFEEDESEPNEKKENNFTLESKIIHALKEIDLFDITPMDAMNELYKLQKEVKKL